MMFAYKTPLKFSFNFAFVTFQLLLFFLGIVFVCLFGGLFGIFPPPNYFCETKLSSLMATNQ